MAAASEICAAWNCEPNHVTKASAFLFKHPETARSLVAQMHLSQHGKGQQLNDILKFSAGSLETELNFEEKHILFREMTRLLDEREVQVNGGAQHYFLGLEELNSRLESSMKETVFEGLGTTEMSINITKLREQREIEAVFRAVMYLVYNIGNLESAGLTRNEILQASSKAFDRKRGPGVLSRLSRFLLRSVLSYLIGEVICHHFAQFCKYLSQSSLKGGVA